MGNYETIKYDKILTNFENGYDKWCGHFVAPRELLYVFSYSVTATNTKTVTVGLIKNGHVILKISTTITSWESGSSTVLVEMDKGDKV